MYIKNNTGPKTEPCGIPTTFNRNYFRIGIIIAYVLIPVFKIAF